MSFKNLIKHGLIFCFSTLLIFSSSFLKLSAEEINWIEVAHTNNQLQYIDVNSIKYNNRGFLTVRTKYSELNPEDHEIIRTNSYLIAVDCENRLFSKLPVNGDPSKVENWENPVNDKLTKKTIINSCTY